MKTILFLLPLLLACSEGHPTCNASDKGFGDAPAVKLEALTVPTVAAGNPCRARFELVRTQADLDAAYAELGAAPAPTVDFASKVVLARVDATPASIIWSVSSAGGLVVGLQGCQEPSELACSAVFYVAPAPLASVDSRTCDAVHCGYQRTY